MSRAVQAIVRNDLRAIRRDHVAGGTIVLTMLGTAVIMTLGAFQDRLPGWSSWFPLMLAFSLVGGPAGFGLLFGLLMVDEGDTGVRDALAVVPVPPTVFVTVRTIVATSWMAVWPVTSIYLMNWTWGAVDEPLLHWLAVVAPLAVSTPAFALVVPTLADDKVGALAVFKGLSFLSLAPVVIFFVPADAWFRPLFIVSPTTWSVEALLAFLGDGRSIGYRWAAGGILYAVALVALVASALRRKVYGLHH